jgi:hypothetical protein
VLTGLLSAAPAAYRHQPEWLVAVAWTLVALLGAATFSTIRLLATALFRLSDRIDTLGRDLRAEMHAGFSAMSDRHPLVSDRLTAAGV